VFLTLVKKRELSFEQCRNGKRTSPQWGPVLENIGQKKYVHLKGAVAGHKRARLQKDGEKLLIKTTSKGVEYLRNKGTKRAIGEKVDIDALGNCLMRAKTMFGTLLSYRQGRA